MGKLTGVEVKLVDGRTAKVVAEVLVGLFAVHQRMWDGRPIGTGYSVTHVPSGIAIWSVQHLPDAVRVAQWLDAGKLIGAEDADAVRWWQLMTDEARSSFRAGLTKIAPRYAEET